MARSWESVVGWAASLLITNESSQRSRSELNTRRKGMDYEDEHQSVGCEWLAGARPPKRNGGAVGTVGRLWHESSRRRGAVACRPGVSVDPDQRSLRRQRERGRA